MDGLGVPGNHPFAPQVSLEKVRYVPDLDEIVEETGVRYLKVKIDDLQIPKGGLVKGSL